MVGLQATALKTQLGPLLNGIVVYDFWLPWAGFATDEGRALLKTYQAKAASAGVDLERVLWVRPPGVPEALRSIEHVLQAGGFPLVLLDLCAEGTPPRIPAAVWPRLRKASAATASALVLLGRRRLAGTFADLALELGTSRPRFERGPDWLAGFETRVRLVRSRLGPADTDVPVHWPAAEEIRVAEAKRLETGAAARSSAA